MSKISNKKIAANIDQEPAVEAIKRMIRYTRKESEKDGRILCAYLLDMALQSLEEGSEDIDLLLRTKTTPLTIGQGNDHEGARTPV